jgi:hypothetical protein
VSGYGERGLDVRVAEALGSYVWHAIDGPVAKYRRLYAKDYGTSFPRCASDHGRLSATWDQDLPRYSADPAAYMGLLEEMRKRGFYWTAGGAALSFFFTCKIIGPGGRAFEENDDLLGPAICRAVLAALEGGAK